PDSWTRAQLHRARTVGVLRAFLSGARIMLKKFIFAVVASAAAMVAVPTSAQAADRDGWGRGDRYDRYDRYDRGRYNRGRSYNRGRYYRDRRSRPRSRVVVRTYSPYYDPYYGGYYGAGYNRGYAVPVYYDRGYYGGRRGYRSRCRCGDGTTGAIVGGVAGAL